MFQKKSLLTSEEKAVSYHVMNFETWSTYRWRKEIEYVQVMGRR
jgi:hypothetical protein